MRETFPYPKCQRVCAVCGQVSTLDKPDLLDVFQCDECTGKWVFDGKEFETALTFLVGPAGIPLHNETHKPHVFD